MINGNFGQGSGPIYFSDMSCRGNESSILHCPRNSATQHDCSHSQDVGVVCQTGKICWSKTRKQLLNNFADK